MAEYKSRYTGEEIDAGIAKANTAIQEHQDISGKVDKETGKGLSTNDYTTAEKTKLAGIDMSTKQDTLVSGTNIKTINNQPLLGSGNITIEGGSTTEYTVPDYFISNMASVLTKIETELETAGPAGDAFIFLTDAHAPNFSNTLTYNSQSIPKSLRLINYIVDNTKINKVIFGGDIMQGNQAENALIETSKAIMDYMHPKAKVFTVRGNHDGWVGNQVRQFALNKYCNVWGRDVNEYCEDYEYTNITSPTGEAYYYYDNKAQKIRYIFTDSIYSSEDSGSSVTSTKQLNWVKDKINELDSSWVTFIIHHGLWTAGKTATLDLNADGIAVIGAIDAAYQTSTCEIGGIIVGHVHRDIAGTSTNGYPYIGTTCDANGAQASYDIVTPTRTVNTTTESAFDVVIINRNTRSIKFFRVGTCGTDRSFSWQEKETGELSSIAVTTNPTKMNYLVGETFDPAGMVVTATMSSGTTKTVIGYTYSPTTALIDGSNTITISYTEGGITKTTTLTVNATSTSYTITNSITNGTASGDTTILDGGTAIVTLSADSGYKLPSSITVTGATYSYNQSTGVVGLSSPIGNVTITAICEEDTGVVDVTDQVKANFTSGPINGNGGTAVTDSNWVSNKRTVNKALDVEGYSNVIVTLANTTTPSGQLGYSFYNSNGTRVGGGTHHYGSAQMGYTLDTLAIPTNAKWFSTTWYSSTHSAVTGGIVNVNDFSCSLQR